MRRLQPASSTARISSAIWLPRSTGPQLERYGARPLRLTDDGVETGPMRVASASERWRMRLVSDEMDDDLYNEIVALCEVGNVAHEAGDREAALEKFREAS